MQYVTYALAVPFDLRCESGTLKNIALVTVRIILSCYTIPKSPKNYQIPLMQSFAVCLHKMLAQIQLWDFIIAGVVKLNLELNPRSISNSSKIHTFCHPRDSQTLFQGEIQCLELYKRFTLFLIKDHTHFSKNTR